jgi:hypothetical protein
LNLCIVGVGFTPGDFINVTFTNAPGGFSGRSGVVDANGQWAYFDDVPYDTSCDVSQTDGVATFSVTEADPNEPIEYPTESYPSSYFCSPPGAGQPDVGPGASPSNCMAPDGTSGLFFGD